MLSQQEDEFRWNLHPNGQFSVKSHYLAMIHNDKCLWKLKAPSKIKVFLWYLHRGVVLTKDNLVIRNWHGSKQCCFCHKDETIKHLFFSVVSLVLSGLLSRRLQACLNRIVYQACLVLGSVV